jgi:hypothetical protein
MPSWIGQVSPLKHDNSIVQTFSPQISSYKGSYSLSYNYITTEPGFYKMKHSVSKNMPMDVKQLPPKHWFLKVWRKFYPIIFNTDLHVWSLFPCGQIANKSNLCKRNLWNLAWGWTTQPLSILVCVAYKSRIWSTWWVYPDMSKSPSLSKSWYLQE